MVVDGGSYVSNGVNSPAVYSTAQIAVNNEKLIATESEAVCIEGLNELRLFDSDLEGNMSENEQNDCTWNVILYQSMSGDSEVGNSTFEMNGGTLTAKNGGMFYTTNTESTFILSGVDITYAEDNPFFLRCTGNSNERGWGHAGENGADCLFTAVNQEMEGDIIWDSISQLDFYLTAGSSLTGAVVQDESCAGDGGDGTGNRWNGLCAGQQPVHHYGGFLSGNGGSVRSCPGYRMGRLSGGKAFSAFIMRIASDCLCKPAVCLRK
ncbi:MAG TPA: hypothetical protein IAA45_05790 [Candidatus Blautia gallistercoris]|uniref:Uncharacterized protein n=1 Tax=Candidatus Blautia gallistercoris TaxID=2838490 RepID=A0A9D1WH99_9FIRM|nr:hypothetical protein [Candidatus Blautia gallistercoris]